MWNGVLATMEYEGQVSLTFAPRLDGTFATPVDYETMMGSHREDIVRVVRHRGSLNIPVDVVVKEADGTEGTYCFLAPRGRMRKIFAAVGHPLR